MITFVKIVQRPEFKKSVSLKECGLMSDEGRDASSVCSNDVLSSSESGDCA